MDLIGVNIGEGQPTVAQFVKEKGISYPIVLDADKMTAVHYGVRGIPNIVLIDKTGVVRFQGYEWPSAATIKKYE